MIQIKRRLKPGHYKITDIFIDLKSMPILSDIFRSQQEIEHVFANTRVIIVDRHHEMSVDNQDGSISIGVKHLHQSDTAILYLDIIHELVHVRQHLDGMDLYDRTKSYVDRPTEIEAYRITLKEAERIGFTHTQMIDYLAVEWISEEELRRLAKQLNIDT